MGSHISALRQINSKRISSEARMREYLRKKRVSLALGSRIHAFFRTKYDARKRQLHETDIEFFGEMPQSMRFQLRTEINIPILTEHPLFFQYAGECKLGAEQIAQLHMSELFVGVQQD